MIISRLAKYYEFIIPVKDGKRIRGLIKIDTEKMIGLNINDKIVEIDGYTLHPDAPQIARDLWEGQQGYLYIPKYSG